MGERRPSPARLTGPVARPGIVTGAWRAGRRLEIVVLAIYFFALIAALDIANVRPGVEIMTAGVIVAALAITRQPRAFFRDWWFLLIGLVLWNLSGPIAAHSPFPAQLDFMWGLDRALWFGRDPTFVLQHALLRPGHISGIDVVTALAYNMHLTEPYVAGYFLWRLNRLVFLRFAAAVLLLLVFGFVTFILLPAIPPWLAARSYGKVAGVVNQFGPVLQSHPLPFHGTPIFYLFKLTGDKIAAFPSEHAAFPLLELLAFWQCTGKLIRLALCLWIGLVFFSVVYLGEHWVTDVLAGYVYALVIFGAVCLLTSRLTAHDRLGTP